MADSRQTTAAPGVCRAESGPGMAADSSRFMHAMHAMPYAQWHPMTMFTKHRIPQQTRCCRVLLRILQCILLIDVDILATVCGSLWIQALQLFAAPLDSDEARWDDHVTYGS